jgi:hypothetical protein
MNMSNQALYPKNLNKRNFSTVKAVKKGNKKMTDSARFDDIYSRLNQLTADVSNLKIQASTYGTIQNAT